MLTAMTAQASLFEVGLMSGLQYPAGHGNDEPFKQGDDDTGEYNGEKVGHGACSCQLDATYRTVVQVDGERVTG
jgi:hypothetical protein